MTACNRQEPNDRLSHPNGNQSQLIGRKLASRMSVATVRQLSDDWHYAVAMADHSSNAVFPDPWVPAGEVAGYEFVPICTPLDLFAEGRTMHNCIASYVPRIVDLQLYIYSVREDDRPVATLAIGSRRRHGGNEGPYIRQIAGPCNASIPRKMERAARRWLSRSPFALPERKSQPVPGTSADDRKVEGYRAVAGVYTWMANHLERREQQSEALR